LAKADVPNISGTRGRALWQKLTKEKRSLEKQWKKSVRRNFERTAELVGVPGKMAIQK
jgi:hypothetical protein